MTTWQRSKDKDAVYKAKPTTHASAMHDLGMVLTLTSKGERSNVLLCIELHDSSRHCRWERCIYVGFSVKTKGITCVLMGLLVFGVAT